MSSSPQWPLRSQGRPMWSRSVCARVHVSVSVRVHPHHFCHCVRVYSNMTLELSREGLSSFLGRCVSVPGMCFHVLQEPEVPVPTLYLALARCPSHPSCPDPSRGRVYIHREEEEPSWEPVGLLPLTVLLPMSNHKLPISNNPDSCRFQVIC